MWQNRLTSFTLPAETTNLLSLLLNGNQLTNVVLPPNLDRLNNLDLGFNLLQTLSLPAGLTEPMQHEPRRLGCGGLVRVGIPWGALRRER